MTKYRPEGTRIRTGIEAEAVVAEALARDGWTVMKRGWPDFICLKGGQIRFIEVKRDNQWKMDPRQRYIADLLRRYYGIKVELVRPVDVKS